MEDLYAESVRQQNILIGGIAIIVFLTFIVSLFALKRKIGFWVVWLISLSVGLVLNFIIGNGLATFISIVLPIILVLTSKKKGALPNNSSTADELSKLKQLLDSGAINETEFNSEKKRILNR